MAKQEIIKEILYVPILERMEIIDAILETIDQPTLEIEQAWMEEVDRRTKEIEEGEIDAIALKRKLSKLFNKKYTNKDGSINYDKLKNAEKRLNIPDKKSILIKD